MKRVDIFFEGKTKKLYNTEKDDQLALEFIDSVHISDDSIKKLVKGKGAINSVISEFLFDYLDSYNVPTQFVKRIDDNTLLVKKLNMIPIKLVIWNVATGSLSKRLGLKDSTLLETPVLEFYLKNEKLKNPFINDYHVYTLGLCDRNEMNSILRMGSKINAVLKSFFLRKRLMLAYFTLEFGKTDSHIMVGDEISADNLKIWEMQEDGKFDKKSLLISSENIKTVYAKIKEKIIT